MRMSIKVQYGLQALIELANQYGTEPIQISEIAKKQSIPVRYLEQLLLILKRREIVNSVRGKRGGYVLLKKPSQIKIIDIIEIFDGPIEFVNKKMKKSPVILETFKKIQEEVKKGLLEITLDDLVYRKRRLDSAYTYNI